MMIEPSTPLTPESEALLDTLYGPVGEDGVLRIYGWVEEPSNMRAQLRRIEAAARARAEAERDRLRDALRDLAERWETHATLIEEATHKASGKPLPKMHRMIAAEALRSAAQELRAALSDPTPEGEK